jgi:phage/plasmid-associated DNA primase
MALADLTSPVGAFVRETCVREAGREISVKELYAAWRQWSKDHGRDRPTTDAVFGRDLRAVIPGLKRVRPGDDKHRRWVYEGIALNAAYAAYMGTDHNGADLGPARTAEGNGAPVLASPRSNPMRSVPDATLDGYVRCSACGTEAQLDTASDYGRQRLAEGHLECGAPWRSAL